MKFYIQDDTMRKQIKGVESVSPSFEDIEWETEDVFDLEAGSTSQKKTVKSVKEFTFTMTDINQSENEGFAMAKLYADEEGDKEEIYIIGVKDNGDEVAIKGCVKSLTNGDYSKEIRKPSFVVGGNKVDEAPEAPVS